MLPFFRSQRSHAATSPPERSPQRATFGRMLEACTRARPQFCRNQVIDAKRSGIGRDCTKPRIDGHLLCRVQMRIQSVSLLAPRSWVPPSPPCRSGRWAHSLCQLPDIPRRLGGAYSAPCKSGERRLKVASRLPENAGDSGCCRESPDFRSGGRCGRVTCRSLKRPRPRSPLFVRIFPGRSRASAVRRQVC